MNLKHKVSILVEPTYLEDHSDPTEIHIYGLILSKLKIIVMIQLSL